jgi:hypothetical protein
MYMMVEPDGRYEEYVWDGSDWVLYFEDPGAETEVDPGLRMPFMRQWHLALERELSADTRLRVSFTKRSHHDLLDRVNLSGEWQGAIFRDDRTGESFEVYRRLNPGENRFLLTNPDVAVDYTKEWGAAFPGIVSLTPERRYQAWEFGFDKRFSKGWQLRISYTYSRALGSDDNIWATYAEDRTSGPGASILYSNPNYQLKSRGRLTIDPTHLLKITGSIRIPRLDIVVGAFYSLASGDTYNRNIRLPDEIDPDPVSELRDGVYILGEEKGNYRLPTQHNLDLRIEKIFSRDSYRVGFLVDVFNAFNAATVTDVQTLINPWTELEFGQVIGIRFPRTFRLGLRFAF